MNISYVYDLKSFKKIKIINIKQTGTATIIENLNLYHINDLNKAFNSEFESYRGVNLLLEDGTLYRSCFIALKWQDTYFFVKDDFNGIIDFIKKYPMCFVRNSSMNGFDCVATDKIYVSDPSVHIMFNKGGLMPS